METLFHNTNAPVSDSAKRAGAIEALYATAHWLLEERRTPDALSVFRAMVLIAPCDERGYLGLGACHEARGEEHIALEIYGAGAVATSASDNASPVRCHVARSRVLRAHQRDDEADVALERAAIAASEQDDADLLALVDSERRAS